MRWHLTQPGNPRIAHRRIRVQALGHSLGDDGEALFLELLQQRLLLGNQRVDLAGFPVEEGGDLLLRCK